MDSEKLVDLFLLLCKFLTTACLHDSEELLWSPGPFLGEEGWSRESSTELALQKEELLLRWDSLVLGSRSSAQKRSYQCRADKGH